MTESSGPQTANHGRLSLSAKKPQTGCPKRFVMPKSAFKSPAWLIVSEIDCASIGMIVGSAVVKLCAQYGEEAAPYVAEYVREMKAAVREGGR